jgi:hypothetical protein
METPAGPVRVRGSKQVKTKELSDSDSDSDSVYFYVSLLGSLKNTGDEQQ